MRPYLASLEEARQGRAGLGDGAGDLGIGVDPDGVDPDLGELFAAEAHLVLDGSRVLEMAGEARVDGRAEGSGRFVVHVSPGAWEG